ncbi:hypothetical protein [Peterkaempfera bronchialis]|uniref:hypothetical protein n=1 Tax=Peterkaempfera bronchialis TaxID=2126346 RepID=UPI0013B3F3FB|nr:hypothetical protein [Peterkaempfera bronchialis]
MLSEVDADADAEADADGSTRGGSLPGETRAAVGDGACFERGRFFECPEVVAA